MDNAGLSDGCVDVWYCLTASVGPVEIKAYDRVLSLDERARRDRFHFEDDRRDFTVAHGMLRRVLSQYGQAPAETWQFQLGPYGKPALPDTQAGSPPLQFNLTHARGVVACAIARGACVGIDVETIQPPTAAREVASHCFAANELDLLAGTAADDYSITFAELWTLKEAYIKAVGGGLSLPLDAFHFSFERAGHLQFGGVVDAAAWQFVLTAPSAGSRMSVAVRADAPTSYRYRFGDVSAWSWSNLPVLRRSHPAFASTRGECDGSLSAP